MLYLNGLINGNRNILHLFNVHLNAYEINICVVFDIF